MADLIRIVKSGGDWTAHDLDAYNVFVVDQPFATFFDIPQLPDIPANLRTFSELPDRAAAIAQTADGDTYKLLNYLDIATSPEVGEDASVDCLVRRLVEKLGYTPGYRTVISRQLLPLLLCGVCCTARVDVVGATTPPTPNRASSPPPSRRTSATTIYTSWSSISPCSTRAPSPASRCRAVIDGTYPPTATIVDRYIPKMPRSQSEGVKRLHNRIAILRHFGAFKQFVVETQLLNEQDRPKDRL